MANDLVRYSRAGDTFHYRWAARRCLRMVYPNATLQSIVIEGSQEERKEGEYVIDVSEYYSDAEPIRIQYYQLKHTTVHTDDAFTLSDLKETFEGFAKRFVQHYGTDGTASDLPIRFTVITNRKISATFKQNISAIAKAENVTAGFKETIETYTGLTGDRLTAFCAIIELQDGEGNYQVQKQDLRFEIAQILPGHVDLAQINNVIALVEEKVLPHSDGVIIKEEVLSKFGISSEKGLYPAPARWEKVDVIIPRQQHDTLKQKILESSEPFIIHAAGGVGKSVFCRQLAQNLDEGSVAIAYDCFGTGSYRSRSTPRHRHHDALVQIANELASQGLCDPLLPTNNASAVDIMRAFVQRVNASVEELQRITADANLLIIVDAADNAEMAANEFSDACFAHELLREQFQRGVKLILLCRTERISLLQPPSSVIQLELAPFSEEESIENLTKHYPAATRQEGQEFHRLTGGNPRVQANALDVKGASAHEVLENLGPSGTSVEDQISLQLSKAVERTKELLPSNFNEHVNAICLGLACLPPHIPIDVLATAAGVSTHTVRSFVSDIGRALWLSDSSIQFRDEPTETWFRSTFVGTKNDYAKYIELLEPLAQHHTYVAETLPQLYLLAQQYEKLITIALSDDYLPVDNPIDTRNVRVYRLQFAFKAALKLNNYKDAIQLAMRAGEEVAGNERQLQLLKDNIDLLVTIQSKEKIQEIAYRRQLSGAWAGSENIYSASLLSSIDEFTGEARGYLRWARNWLKIYFEEAKKSKDIHREDKLTDDDLLELAYAYLNTDGVDASFRFLDSLIPKSAIFPIVRRLTQRLINNGKYETVNEFLVKCVRNTYFQVAIVSEMMDIGMVPDQKYLADVLQLLAARRTRIQIRDRVYRNDAIVPSIIAFLEACLHHTLAPKLILRVLRYYIPERASTPIVDSHRNSDRDPYMRALAIRALLNNTDVLNFETILPLASADKKSAYKQQNEEKKYHEIIGGLFPWYLVRAKLILQTKVDFTSDIARINEESKKARSHRYGPYDTLPQEIASICAEILMHCNTISNDELQSFYESYLADAPLYFPQRIQLLRASFRLAHLDFMKRMLEKTTYAKIRSFSDDGPDALIARFIDLAKAIVISSADDAGFYFNEAVKIASKFGDEVSQRWQAIQSLGNKASDKGTSQDEIAYRFIRCAEVVGELVEDKYWDRPLALRICTRLSPGSAISALSRWRDRNVGYFDELLRAIAIELVSTEKISPSFGWAITRLQASYFLNDLLSICLEKERSPALRERLLEDAITTMQKDGSGKDNWEELLTVARARNTTSSRLQSIVTSLPSFKKKYSNSFEQKTLPDKQDAWNSALQNLDLCSATGLTQANKNVEESDELGRYSYRLSFWKEVVMRVPEDKMWSFIDAFLNAEFVSYFDVHDLISALPQSWMERPSVKDKWKETVKAIGSKFAYELSEPSALRYFLRDSLIPASDLPALKSGIFQRLSAGNEFNHASLFFGFVTLCSELITADEAIALLDYSLSRFELHLDDSSGDGPWSEKLVTTGDVQTHLAGLIWSALGAPQRAMRWKAVHTVRQLIELNQDDGLDRLMKWCASGHVGAFGDLRFPFYELHARMYLLIALARASLSAPANLIKYVDVTSKYAFEPHVSMQKFAVDMLRNVESAFPGTVKSEILSKLPNVHTSAFPIEKVQYGYRTDSPWHANKEYIKPNEEYHFGWDFDRYWFEPLAEMFAIPGKQAEDLAEVVVRNEWKIIGQNTYKEDPRHYLWDRYDDRETWHSHFEYPRTDNLNFYYSFHSLQVVASKLLERMPLATHRDENDEEWGDWLTRHTLTRSDGLWLSDLRDPVPINRPKWVGKKITDNWEKNVTASDFYNAVVLPDTNQNWLSVKGSWHEIHEHHKETYTVASALVSPSTSDALLRALSSCRDPHDYKLPYYHERDVEIDTPPFSLKGWFTDKYAQKGLDQYDPFTNEISYPLNNIGQDIITKLKLKVSQDGKIWHAPISEHPSLISGTWNSFRQSRDEEHDQSGNRTKASVAFLQYLCQTLDCELIIDVLIQREKTYRYGREDYKRQKPKHKLFILSGDGTLRDDKTTYQFR